MCPISSPSSHALSCCERTCFLRLLAVDHQSVRWCSKQPKISNEFEEEMQLIDADGASSQMTVHAALLRDMASVNG